MKISWLGTLLSGIATETATSLARRLGFELTSASRAAYLREELDLDLAELSEEKATYYSALLTIARGECRCLVRDPCDACLAAHVIDYRGEEEPAERSVA